MNNELSTTYHSKQHQICAKLLVSVILCGDSLDNSLFIMFLRT